MSDQETINDIRKMYADTPQAAFSLLLEVVASQGREIEYLKANQPRTNQPEKRNRFTGI